MKGAHHELLLFAIVMFCKITVNTELADPEPLLLGDIQGDVPASLTTFTSTNQYITLFHMCLKACHTLLMH